MVFLGGSGGYPRGGLGVMTPPGTFLQPAGPAFWLWISVQISADPTEAPAAWRGPPNLSFLEPSSGTLPLQTVFVVERSTEAPASPCRFAALRLHEAPRSRICPGRNENVGFLVLQSTVFGTPPFYSVKAPRSLRATDRLFREVWGVNPKP